METRAPRHYDLPSLIPIVAGLWGLLAAHGWGWLPWGLLPGVLLLSSGVSMLLWHEVGKQTQYMALGALIGALFWLPAAWTGSAGGALVALLLVFLSTFRSAIASPVDLILGSPIHKHRVVCNGSSSQQGPSTINADGSPGDVIRVGTR